MNRKKIVKVICIFMIILLGVTTFCMANEEKQVLTVMGSDKGNTKEVEIEAVGMKFRIDQNLYDVIQGLKNGDEKVEPFQKSKQNLQKAGIVFNAVDSLEDNMTKEVVIMVSQNQNTKQIEDLTKLDEEELKRSE